MAVTNLANTDLVSNASQNAFYLRVSRKRSMISSPRTLYSIAEIEVIDTSAHPTTCLSSASRLNSPTVAHCALERTGCFCRARDASEECRTRQDCTNPSNRDQASSAAKHRCVPQ